MSATDRWCGSGLPQPARRNAFLAGDLVEVRELLLGALQVGLRGVQLLAELRLVGLDGLQPERVGEVGGAEVVVQRVQASLRGGDALLGLLDRVHAVRALGPERGLVASPRAFSTA